MHDPDAATNRDQSAIETSFFEALEAMDDDNTLPKVALTGRVAVWLKSWRDKHSNDVEELRDSPLVHHWRELDRERREEGQQTYNMKRRLAYQMKVEEDQDRPVRAYRTDEHAQQENRRENDRKRKATRRASLPPEEAAARRAADALRKKKARAAKKI
tara:strand:+ start:143 stop:616 length:474 start_codon:yes stop_codon:yes gene_type:complete